MNFKGNWIQAQWCRAISGGVLRNISAIDRDIVLHEFADSSEEDVINALDAAEKAQKNWAKTSPPKRGKIFFKAASLMHDRDEEAAILMTKEMGKPINEARGEIARCIDLLEYYGAWGWRLGGERVGSGSENTNIYTMAVPLGVVSMITPWNFPSAIPLWKIAPALIAGNCVVLKPASQAPASSLLIAEIFEEASLPGGVLNIVCGRGSKISRPLLTDERVRAVSFTGSCEVGQKVYETASAHNRRVGLEMGGKNPLIVCEDADIDLAVELAVAGSMQLAGQKCTATSRVIVDEKIAGVFTEKLITKVNALKTDDPLDEATDVGPVIDEESLENILKYIERGKGEGAALAAGGRRLTDGELSKAAYCEPTVFTNVVSDMAIAKEEIFGPVLAVLSSKDFEQAMTIANDTAYGLSASICTSDMKLAQKFTEQIEAGLVHVNSMTSGAEVHVPFGGMKGSSSGFREMGGSGIDFYTNLKTVYYSC